MIFRSISLSTTGVVTAKMEGHATDVVKAFHDVADLLLTRRGAWRIVSVVGGIDDGSDLDSDMDWTLIAKLK